ncbi:D-glycero-beta-D-manno-heptose 1-phosphate adenylyltransferase [Xanthobacter dioxanivorans]|uniref:Bifunctional protein HldE n=1 Tax=Xanthobacter dioxanivorans TaxID=2528964 RepID=A0A974SHN9_9HYPH|nr:D-glycero-beta-D-manno-heptose 1-phosphate adenylyltransferase [Xanthobacter dioxanivorans]QRG05890.1 D-glycero-beta-D-manno-heptose 1-phosphate adenylyltransferase [Xanthobacter dioxanivorans]
MLDRFVYGEAERVSPEAPALVLRYQSEATTLGGAGNVARNIAALGGHAILAGVIGRDAEGDLIADRLVGADGIEGRWVRPAGVPTTVKTRYVSAGQQLMRFDREAVLVPDEEVIADLVRAIEREIETIDAIVLSDYAKGVLAQPVIRRVIDLAKSRDIPVVVDPKTRDVHRYAGATVLTPNTLEASALSGTDCSSDDSAAAAARAISISADVAAVVLTRGAKGMMIWDTRHAADGVIAISTAAREVFDVSGAGDTVVSALVLGLAAGATVAASARVANAAAGIAVGKRGTAVVHAHELVRVLGRGADGNTKIVAGSQAAEIAASWKADGLVVGFTNGCFDLIHPGHIELLRKARATCDRLVVALNTDASVRRLKGETRPIQNETARAIVMAAIDSVDLVTLFDEDTPLSLIELLRPDRLIKGGDYSVATVVGADVVASYGGEVVIVPLEAGQSTTSIVARSRGGGRG